MGSRTWLVWISFMNGKMDKRCDVQYDTARVTPGGQGMEWTHDETAYCITRFRIFDYGVVKREGLVGRLHGWMDMVLEQKERNRMYLRVRKWGIAEGQVMRVCLR
jgi:hypothetical protein